jgi:protein SMG6
MRVLIKQAKEKTTARRYAAVVAPSPKSAPVWNTTRKLYVQPGYTVLVIDTSILLTAFALFTTIVECERWKVIVPLAALSDLDSLKGSGGQLGDSAARVVIWLEQNSRPHLKVQTNRGNYLADLSIRLEEFDFQSSLASSTDDLVLQAAKWQQEHFIATTSDASKVAIVSFNRTLRHKARSRGLEGVNEVEVLRLILPKLPDG